MKATRFRRTTGSSKYLSSPPSRKAEKNEGRKNISRLRDNSKLFAEQQKGKNQDSKQTNCSKFIYTPLCLPRGDQLTCQQRFEPISSRSGFGLDQPERSAQNRSRIAERLEIGSKLEPMLKRATEDERSEKKLVTYG